MIATVVSMSASLLHAENWAHWRGPNFNGSTSETGFPESWSQTDNIAWSVDLPGSSAATPIVYGDTVFVSSVDATKNTLLALAFDRKTGKKLWERVVAEGTSQDTRSNYASPSPTTDGKHVYFFYGNGDLVAFTMQGEEAWKRDLQEDFGPFAFQWTFSTSPTLWNNKLYMQVLQRDVPVEGKGRAGGKIESYLLALDLATGKTIWRHVRPSEANAESLEAFSTPIPFEHDGRTELLITGGDVITGHNPETGEELWRWGTWNPERIGHWRLVPSPVAGGGVVLACAPKQNPIYAVKLGGEGTLDDSALAWISKDTEELSTDVPTPAFDDGDFFVLSDVRKTLVRSDPATGKVEWSVKTPGRVKYEASPLVADGKVYIVNFDGLVTVLKATDGTILNEIPMDAPQDGEMVRSSIAASQGQLFIRTTRKLYCVGK
jgi:outer membrane protein assembly factor BamB